MKLSKKALAGVLSALTIAVMTAGCGEVNIGYIDETRLNEECPQIKASTEEWQKKLEELQNTTMQQLNDAAAKGATQEEIGKIQQEAQMKAAAMNNDFQSQTRTKVDIAIDEVAKAKKIDTVVKSSKDNKTVVSGGTDITDDVIQKLQ